MKKIRISVLALLLAGSVQMANAQTKSIDIQLDHKETTFSQNGTQSVTVFKIKCSPTELRSILNKASEISESATLVFSDEVDGVYTGTLTCLLQNHPEYVHKMFFHLGFENFSLDGKTHPLNELPEALKQL